MENSVKTVTQKIEVRNQNSVWYALYTKPRFEKKVISVLTMAGYDVYLPLISTVRQWSDRKKKIQTPLINSYVFVQIEEEQLNDLLKYQGVVRVLKHLGKPAKIQEKEIENLKIICEHSEEVVVMKDTRFKSGTPIQITGGPMNGLYGEYIKINGNHRVLVMVKELGMEFVLDVSLSYIKPLMRMSS